MSISPMWIPRPGSNTISRLWFRSKEVIANLASFSGRRGEISSLGSPGGCTAETKDLLPRCCGPQIICKQKQKISTFGTSGKSHLKRMLQMKGVFLLNTLSPSSSFAILLQ